MLGVTMAMTVAMTMLSLRLLQQLLSLCLLQQLLSLRLLQQLLSLCLLQQLLHSLHSTRKPTSAAPLRRLLLPRIHLSETRHRIFANL